MSNEDSQKTTYKIIIIGDSAVGKTCIFKKIVSGVFTEKSISTIGMDRRTLSFKIKNSEGNDLDIDVQLWDTAGEERFRSITASYYKSSQGLLLMYDITNRDTFDSIGNWIENITDSLGEDEKYLIVLIGNKLDLADQRVVTTEEAENLCKEKKIFWGGECSAKDFTEEQLKEIFTGYTQEIYKIVGVKNSKSQIVGKRDKTKKSFC